MRSQDCETECLSVAACVGYSYVSSGTYATRCIAYGPGLDVGLPDSGGGSNLMQWYGTPSPVTEIGAAANCENQYCYEVQAYTGDFPPTCYQRAPPCGQTHGNGKGR
jgi:hypothetical protein